ncbi:MAG: M48 family metalloprotease [Armatimonadota bacterium]|nr:M48 family metalloprotease [Armatimonadota bacterium]
MRLSAADYRHPGETPTLVAACWLAITLLAAAEGLLVWLIVARPGLPWVSGTLGMVLLIGFNVGGLIGALQIRTHKADLIGSARRVGPSRLPRVHQAAEDVARRLALPGTPPVYVLPLENLDSFVIAWDTPAVFVTEGLAEQLDDLELRAALAHELAHLKGGDARLMTLIYLPLRARLLPPVLLGPQAVGWLALRWWMAVAELSADRAAAVAVRGLEPVAHWLSAEIEDPEEPGLDLHRYLGYLDREQWRLVGEELRRAYPRVGARILELARFVQSRRFARCLAIVGDLHIQPLEAPDPSSPGVLPYVAMGMLSGLWLAPLTVALTVAVGAPPSPAPATVEAPPATRETEQQPAEQTEPPDEAGAPNPFASGQSAVSLATEADFTEQGMLDVARMHKERGELDKARRALEDLLQQDPTIAEAHYLMAWTCVDMGDHERAAQEFQATVNLTDPDSEMHQEASDALERMEP